MELTRSSNTVDMDGMSVTHSHQGVIAIAAVREYVSVEDILRFTA